MKRVVQSAGPVFYHGQMVGNMWSDDIGCYLCSTDETALEPIKGVPYANEDALNAAIEAALPAERKMEIRAWRARIDQNNRQRAEEAERRRVENTWTGEFYDPDKPLKTVAGDIKRSLVEAVKSGELPAPADFKVTTAKAEFGRGPYVRIWTDHLDTPDRSTVRDRIYAIANKFNQSVGTGKDPADDGPDEAMAFRVEVEDPSPFKAGETKALWKAGYSFNDIFKIGEQRRRDRMRRKGFPEAKLPGGAE